ncbi:MAG: hypothetical protein JST55_14015 [Bacteroidetes bacterium]|nr:hypothetical protein [Bacteroidota bacterium]
MNTELHYSNPRNYRMPDRLFNSGRVMFVVCAILTLMIVIFASSRG